MVLKRNTMSLMPTDPKKIRARIRRYERSLKAGLADGYCDDGAGKRYFLGPLYMLIGDEQAALASYRWYSESFPGDSGDEGQYLCWSLALLRSGDNERAQVKLRQAMLMNRFALPRLLQEQYADAEPGTSHIFALAHVDSIPPEFFSLWSDEERQWARSLYYGQAFTKQRTRLAEINEILENEPRGPHRTMLVDEASAMRRSSEPM